MSLISSDDAVDGWRLNSHGQLEITRNGLYLRIRETTATTCSWSASHATTGQFSREASARSVDEAKRNALMWADGLEPVYAAPGSTVRQRIGGGWWR